MSEKRPDLRPMDEGIEQALARTEQWHKEQQRQARNSGYNSPSPSPHGRTRMIVFPLRRSVGFKAETAS